MGLSCTVLRRNPLVLSRRSWHVKDFVACAAGKRFADEQRAGVVAFVADGAFEIDLSTGDIMIAPVTARIDVLGDIIFAGISPFHDADDAKCQTQWDADDFTY